MAAAGGRSRGPGHGAGDGGRGQGTAVPGGGGAVWDGIGDEPAKLREAAPGARAAPRDPGRGRSDGRS